MRLCHPSTASCYCTDSARLERACNSNGSDGNASAASSMSSTGCCAARPIPRFMDQRQSARREFRSTFVTCITLDADTRLPRESLRRLIGKLSHPLNQPRFDRGNRTRRRRLCRTAASRHAIAAHGRGGIALSTYRVERTRHRPLCVRRLGRVPGLSSARARMPARESTTSTRFEAALAHRASEGTLLSHDLFEGNLRARGSREPTLRSSKSFLRATTSLPRASIAGHAATGSCCCHGFSVGAMQPMTDRRHSRSSAAWSLEDARQPAPHAVRAGKLRRAGVGLDICRYTPPCLDRLHPGNDRLAGAAPG